MERKIVFSEGEYYHIYNRGVEKRKIFLTREDYNRFVRLLYLANSSRSFVYRDLENKKIIDIDRGTPLVAIGAWVLMPNHFHILIKEVTEDGASLFMQKLLTGYSSYFNKKYRRVGGLFQGVFQAQHADSDEYLKYLFAYIHLNPIKLKEPKWREMGICNVKTGIDFLKKYYFSSYLDHTGVARDENKILTGEEFPEYFLDIHDFDSSIQEWLTIHDTGS